MRLESLSESEFIIRPIRIEPARRHVFEHIKGSEMYFYLIPIFLIVKFSNICLKVNNDGANTNCMTSTNSYKSSQ